MSHREGKCIKTVGEGDCDEQTQMRPRRWQRGHGTLWGTGGHGHQGSGAKKGQGPCLRGKRGLTLQPAPCFLK